MDAAGPVTSRHDYLPFGEEIVAGTGAQGNPTGMRTAAQGYSAADNVRQRYADTRLDDATGLDHTLWRKLEPMSGRWTTPDPYGGNLKMLVPQSFNRYAYVENDPVNFVDPSGLDGEDEDVITTTIWEAGWDWAFFFFSAALQRRPVTEFEPRGRINFDPQNPGGQLSDIQDLTVKVIELAIVSLLGKSDCAALLGGVDNALSLLNRAQVLNANTLSPTYRGTQGMFSSAASTARAEAANPSSQILAYSESGSASINGRTILPRNIYLTDRFFTNVGPSQQLTVFIHELNRLNGYSGEYKEDYANITKACGTADPFGPRQ